MYRSSARSWGCFASCDLDRADPPHARAGAASAAPRREPRVPRLRRVRAARGRDDQLPRVRIVPARGGRGGKHAATIRDAGGVTAGRSRLEESPDTTGQDAGETQAAKADGKWHRKETARGDSPETPKARVKRWGKSPPASWRHGG